MPLGKVILINAILGLVCIFTSVPTNCPQHMSENIRVHSNLLSSFQEHYFQTEIIINLHVMKIIFCFVSEKPPTCPVLQLSVVTQKVLYSQV